MTAVDGTVSVVENATGTTLDVPVPTGTGELLIGVMVNSIGTAPPLPAGWTDIGITEDSVCSARMFWMASAGAAASYTFDSGDAAADRITGMIARITGVDAADAFDLPTNTAGNFYASGATSVTSFDFPDITTVTNGAMLLSVAIENAASSSDQIPPATDTVVGKSTDVGRDACMTTEARPTAGAVGVRTWTQTSATARPMGGMRVVLKPTAGSDVTAPSVPANVTATADSASQVTISWDASTDDVGVASYRIRREGADLPGATALTGTSYADASVAASTTYSYTVSAVDAAGNRSAESAAATVTTPAGTGLQPPTGLTVTTVSSTELDLSWNAASGATGYDIERDGVVIVTDHATTSYADTGLTPSTTYTYRVRSTA